MKKNLILLITGLFLIQQLPAQVRTINDLVGRWEITGKDNETASLDIIDSSNIFLTFEGERKKILSYSTDFSKTPAWFDFTISDTSGILKIRSLVQVYDNSVMKWQLFMDEEERPAYFSATRGEMIYLKKKPVINSITHGGNSFRYNFISSIVH